MTFWTGCVSNAVTVSININHGQETIKIIICLFVQVFQIVETTIGQKGILPTELTSFHAVQRCTEE